MTERLFACILFLDVMESTDLPSEEPAREKPIQVNDPLTGRFLFRYYKKQRIVELPFRGVRVKVYLNLLENDRTDPKAIVTQPTR